MSVSTESSTVRILVVGSSKTVAASVSESVKEAGWSPFTAIGAEDALALLRTQPADVLVTEMRLIGMSGSQLAQAAFRMHPQITALILVGPGEFPIARPALASGICELLANDATPEFVIQAVERLISRRESARRSLWQNTQDVLLKTIKSIATAVDAKSEFASLHSHRVAHFCIKAMPKMELSEYESKTLELAAYVHDLGKIGTPDDVLCKAGSLNDEEWVDVLKHPAFGSVIFAEIEEMADVAAAVRHHHEHFDGRGYPDGLAGEAIPKLARILAVVDAYEAMTSPRPYRSALTHMAAVYELQKNSGSQFDPWIVERFLEALDTDADSGQRAA